jgi:hypothetical protein
MPFTNSKARDLFGNFFALQTKENHLKVAIVIPVYKEELSSSEQSSLHNVLHILHNYEVVFCCPQSLHTHQYENISKEYNTAFQKITFADFHFKNIRSYNAMLLSGFFYEAFLQWDYILLHQLDAWVFKDSLNYWCEQGYDYIGAPWFYKFANSKASHPMLPWAGNGGFSLRKTASSLQLVQQLEQHASPFKSRLLLLWLAERRHKWSALKALHLCHSHTAKQLYIMLDIWEDQVFAILHNNHWKVAPPAVSFSFSFETQPARLYKLNNQSLPFGCHAWEKYEPEFWENHGIKPYC